MHEYPWYSRILAWLYHVYLVLSGAHYPQILKGELQILLRHRSNRTNFPVSFLTRSLKAHCLPAAEPSSGCRATWSGMEMRTSAAWSLRLTKLTVDRVLVLDFDIGQKLPELWPLEGWKLELPKCSKLILPSKIKLNYSLK